MPYLRPLSMLNGISEMNLQNIKVGLYQTYRHKCIDSMFLSQMIDQGSPVLVDLLASFPGAAGISKLLRNNLACIKSTIPKGFVVLVHDFLFHDVLLRFPLFIVVIIQSTQ
jgi:hypothetical protein